jgi:carboxyl-terminal processing protease
MKAKSILRFALRSLAILILLALVFVGGFSFQDIRLGLREPQLLGATVALIPEQLKLSMQTVAYGEEDAISTSPLDVYADTLETVKSDYYGKIASDRDLTYSAIRGMMGSLGDRYTRFLAPDDWAKMQEDNEGQFVGIGAQLDQNPKGQVYVVKPLPNSPAIRAHIQSGDIILKVNNKPVVGLDITRVVQMIRGEPKTPVILTIARTGGTKPITVTIIRNYVRQEVVVSQMVDPVHKIGYIALAQFNEESDPQIDKALSDLQAQGMRALIFDLRGNPGGLLNAAQDVASRFVATGPIVWVKERGSDMEPLSVEPKQHDHPRYPVAVLVNDGSASGVLIGERTFGKGLVQTIIPLPDKSAVAITTAHYYTPAKHDINHKGIEPNIAITLTDQDERNMNTYADQHPADVIDLQYDRQLRAAVDNLTQRLQAGERPRQWSQ